MRLAFLFSLLVPFLPAQAKLEAHKRDALVRQEAAVGNVERALAKGNPTLTQVANWRNGLASVRAELERHKVPTDHPQYVALLERVVAAESKVAEADAAAAAVSWANVEAAFTAIEGKADAVQHERELRPLHKQLDEIAAFAASRPGDPQARSATERVAQCKERAAAALAGKQAGDAQKAALVDPKNYPTLQQDCAELDGLFERFRGFGDVRRDPSHTASLCQQWQAAAEYHKHCLQTYRALLGTDSQLGKDVRARIQRVGEVLIGFRDKAVEFQKATPPAVREALAAADELAVRGQAEQRPAFFTGGVRQRLDTARQWLAAYAAIRGAEDADVVALQKEVDAVQLRVDAIAATLAEKILAEARPPEDLYRGSDRAALEAQVRAAWAKAYPQDEVLGVRFPMAAWKRAQTSTWYPTSRSWQHTDQSVLRVTFLVRTSPEIATSYPAYLNKDHLSQDSITAGVDTKGSAYVSETMLVKNLGPFAAPR